MQLERAKFVYYRVPGVVAALIAHYEVGVFRQEIHHATLAFITPVHSTDY